MPATVQRNKRRQAREETRRQILDITQEFLRERSFRDLSIEEIMSRTGHTRTVFYRHFEDIPALMLTLIAEVGAELVEMGAQWAGADSTSPDEARARLAGFIDFHVRNGALVRAVSEATHHDEAVAEAYAQMVEGFIALTAQTMQTRIDRGEMEPLDAPEIARALFRMLSGYLEDSLGRQPTTDPERVLETVWTIWTRTLFPAR
jgi:AcrR family transcriptional regulator